MFPTLRIQRCAGAVLIGLALTMLADLRMGVRRVTAGPPGPSVTKVSPPVDVPTKIVPPCVAAQYSKLATKGVELKAKYPDATSFETAWVAAKKDLVSRAALEAAGCKP